MQYVDRGQTLAIWIADKMTDNETEARAVTSIHTFGVTMLRKTSFRIKALAF